VEAATDGVLFTGIKVFPDIGGLGTGEMAIGYRGIMSDLTDDGDK